MIKPAKAHNTLRIRCSSSEPGLMVKIAAPTLSTRVNANVHALDRLCQSNFAHFQPVEANAGNDEGTRVRVFRGACKA